MQRWILVLLFLLSGWGALHWWRQRPIVQAPGILAPDAPLQVDLDNGAQLQRGDITLTTRARFELTARVLSHEDYRYDAGASLAPEDLALGWGRMSDSAVLAKISISQSNRFYYWHVDEFPIPRREIEVSSANMHMIPSDDTVRRSLERVRTGQLVHLTGFLVDASRPNGWHWHTSMTREDTGDGACELVYVESIDTVTP
ncbi:hypothetical protein GCM10007862_13060 [Dyella lipolytica]|uniref:Lipopolysaccharide export system protein LptC n=1 Tax=Dyella lipolytica TaxID=1867835 RepID=A0ABW8IU41_9GAMM|nr:hypothetical protein [Dyella lipolytica]GLQ46255.1 hypothetical protein GCM10007862_13060 [Dyella lipolytica]